MFNSSENFPMLVLYRDNTFGLVERPGGFKNGVSFMALQMGLSSEEAERYKANKESIDLELAKTLADFKA